MKLFLTIVSLFLFNIFILFSQSVGSLCGDLVVDMRGASTYTVPIYVSSGTNGFHPDINLIYNSMSGIGVLGVGWNIGGLSVISRVPNATHFDNKVQGLKYDNTDRFSIDGQRLLPLNNDYSLNDLDSTIYRRSEEDFSRIYSYSNNSNYPISFKVFTKDGKIIEYNERVRDPLTGVPISWLVSRITDANGNYIDFLYTDSYGSSVSYNYYGLQNYYKSDILISKIKYMVNSNLNLSPSNEIDFIYETNNDYVHFYGCNKNLFSSSSHRLLRIESKFSGTIVRGYDFAYDDSSSSEQYFLHKITESNLLSEFYNSTIFTWNKSLSYTNNGLEYSNYFGGKDSNSHFGRVATNSNFDEKMERLVGDINGDGLSDIISFKGKSYSWLGAVFGIGAIISSIGYDDTFMIRKVGINDGNNGFDIIDLSNHPDFRLNKIINLILLDEDGDGIDELVITRRKDNFSVLDEAYIDFYNFSNNNFTSYKTYKIRCNNPIPSFCNVVASSVDDAFYSMLFGDVDGDGLLDLVHIKADDNGFRTVLHNSHKKGEHDVTDCHWTNLVSNSRPYRSFLSDVNGDGLSDFCLFVNNNVYVYFSKGDGTFSDAIVCLSGHFTKSQGWNENTEIQVFDINGDGLSDIIGIKGGIIYVGISLGDRFIFSYNCGTINRNDGIDNILKYPLQYRDINNDGLIDVVFFSHTEIEILLNSLMSNIFPQFTSIGVQSNDFGNNLGWDDAKYRRTFGDFNGDGVFDVFGFSNNYLYVLKGQSNYPARITKITDGLENTTIINYLYRRNDVSNNNLYVYLNYDLLSIGPSVLVNKVIKNTNDSVEIFNSNYLFSNPIFERAGKGFIGFLNVKQTDNINNSTIFTQLSLICDNKNLGFLNERISFMESPIIVPTLIEKYIKDSIVSTTNYKLYSYYGFNEKKSYIILPRIITEDNHIENTSKETNFFYNSNDVINWSNTYYVDARDNLNLISYIIYYYDGIGSKKVQKFAENKIMSYENIGFRNFKIISDTVQKYYVMWSKYHHKTWNDYNYDIKGNLTQSITNASFYPFNTNNILSRTIEYNYDTFGNITERKLNDERTTTYTYDNRGQFLTSEITPTGEQTDYTYDNGNLISKTEVNNNLTTTYSYDSWGKLLSTTYSDGSILYYGKLKWCVSGVDEQGLYYSEVRKDDENGTLLSKKYYNSIGNEIENISYSGFAGANEIKTSTIHNNKGQIIRKTFPSKHNNFSYTSYTYDIYNRLKTEMNEYKNIEYVYYDYDKKVKK